MATQVTASQEVPDRAAIRLYRWHVADPVRFGKDLRITIQALGWRRWGRYLPLKSDIAFVAYWYPKEPPATFPTLPSRDDLKVY